MYPGPSYGGCPGDPEREQETSERITGPSCRYERGKLQKKEMSQNLGKFSGLFENNSVAGTLGEATDDVQDIMKEFWK